eukprot:TRINITY_DN1911_c0_g1_i2.p2 TRINITY_DN1911_c0_g1~~TRINITY_DN1911_c0_g1_i2.p2  ORF type:complete len:410 (-),score=107.59 TRINITY_DN1911_c0_g1_i2:38-1267(-)
MMGNLGLGLKTHAVTMFEVGKLSDESLPHFLRELDAIDLSIADDAEGEARTYVDHALSIRVALSSLKNLAPSRGIDLLRCERINSLDEPTRLRILQRNYSILISMAPISTDTQKSTQLIPNHFGPALKEISSPWFQLYFYSLIGHGPPSILYPRGSRVKILPEVFVPYDKVLLTTWGSEETSADTNDLAGNVSESSGETQNMLVMKTSFLLATLNDALLYGPVFVQGYSFVSSPKIAHIPFPLPPLNDDQNLNDDQKLNERKMEVGEKWIRLMEEELCLKTGFGYVTMIHPGVEGDNGEEGHEGLGVKRSKKEKEEVERMGDEGWVVFGVNYGMPLFDMGLTKRVCEGIGRGEMLGEKNVAEMTMGSRLMCNKLLDFIERNQAEDYRFEVEVGAIPCPTKEVVFVPKKE